MTKMVAMPIYCKNLQILFLQNQKSYELETLLQHQGHKLCKFCVNDDPGLTLAYFMALKFLSPVCSIWEIVTKSFWGNVRQMIKLTEEFCL